MEVQKVFSNYYIALGNHDFSWTEQELKDFREMWNDDLPFNIICRRLERRQIEVAVLIMDQADQGIIKKRKIGLGMKGIFE